MILGIHHVQITVRPDDVERAKEFYCNVLDLREIVKPDALISRGGFWLEVGNLQVHVGVENGIDRLATKAHIAYEVRDLGAWRLILEEQGIHVAGGPPIPGHRRFEFRDPFGNRVELIERVLD
jgi:catechol 2,3-dioxygenase-like lactoylglutathione lyase family enzyme